MGKEYWAYMYLFNFRCINNVYDKEIEPMVICVLDMKIYANIHGIF